jgi:hypothetical protein
MSKGCFSLNTAALQSDCSTNRKKATNWRAETGCIDMRPHDPGTRHVMTMTRWFESARESHHDPVWETGKGGA